MPVYVTDLNRPRSGDGDRLCILGSLPSTTSVGSSLFRPFNHSPVFLVSPCPNCHGWIYWSGLRIFVEITDTGFSSAIHGIGADNNSLTKSSASACSTRLSLNHLAPDTARCVQGGCAIIRSYTPSLPYSISLTSPCICHGWSDGSKSHDVASWPRLRKASLTTPDISHATNTRAISIVPLPVTVRRYHYTIGSSDTQWTCQSSTPCTITTLCAVKIIPTYPLLFQFRLALT